jgi:hypothetical protein
LGLRSVRISIFVLSACVFVGCHTGAVPESQRGPNARDADEPPPSVSQTDDSATTISMRLVDEGGALARRRFAVQVEGSSSQKLISSVMRGVTDDDGRASIRWRLFDGILYARVWREAGEQPDREGTKKVADVGATVVDLGNIECTRPALLVSGVVRTESGTPIPNVQVEVHEWVKAGINPVTSLKPGERMGDAWVDVREVTRFRTHSDAQGRFTIVGSSGISELGFSAVKPGYRLVATPDTMFVHPGQTDVRLVLSGDTVAPR